ncbi:MAG: aminoacyl-tRNA deacylase [Gammaproteobacteria bacterium]
MGIAITLQNFLSSQGIVYDTVTHSHTYSSMDTAHAAHVPGDLVAKAVLLEDEEGYVVAVVPATHKLELGMIHNQFSRNLTLASEREVGEIFKDCELGAIPALGTAYGLETVCEESLLDAPHVYLEAGDHEHLIHLTGEQFRRLMDSARHAHISYHM